MKRQISLLCCSILLVAPVACDDDDSINRVIGPSETVGVFNDISGRFSGVVVGVSQEAALDGLLHLSFAQDQGTVTGSWALTGILTDGDTTSVVQEGTFTGTVTSGDNPTFSITLVTPACPNYVAQFSGTLDTSTGRLTATGPVDILDSSCNVVQTFPADTHLNPSGTTVPPPSGGTCVTATEDGGDGDGNGTPSLDPALFAVDFTLDAALDGIADDGNLPISIEQVCDVPASLASNAAQLIGADGIVLLTGGTTEIRTCGDAENAVCEGSLLEDGSLLTGAAATTALDGADEAIMRVRLVPQSEWATDEDGNAIPTFRAQWIKIID